MEGKNNDLNFLHEVLIPVENVDERPPISNNSSFGPPTASVGKLKLLNIINISNPELQRKYNPQSLKVLFWMILIMMP